MGFKHDDDELYKLALTVAFVTSTLCALLMWLAQVTQT